MRYLASTAALVLFTAMAFSSCTCHDQVEPRPQIDDSASGFNVKVSSTPSAAPRAQVASPTAVAATPTAAATVSRPSPTPPDRLPTDFPSEVPVIPGSTLAQVQDLANSARNVIFTSDKPVLELVKTYEDTLGKAGWRITQQFTRDQHAFATYEKGNMSVNVTIVTDADAPGQQVIAVMYEEQKPLDFPEVEDDE